MALLRLRMLIVALLSLSLLGTCENCAVSDAEGFEECRQRAKVLLQTKAEAARQVKSTPNVMSWDGATLLALQKQLAESTAPDWALAAQQQLLKDAEAVKDLPAGLRKGVGAGPWSPTQKKVMPPSKDKRDYRTISGYFWPCNIKCEDTEYYKQGKCSAWDSGKVVYSDAICNESTGEPYVGHDGFLNYDNLEDLNIMIVAMDSLETLTLASWFSFDTSVSAAYAQSAMKIFRAYLLENSTRLNPRFLFGGAIPGKYPNGTAGALIAPTFRMNSRFIDCATLLKLTSPKVWTEEDETSWNAWLQAWLKWLRESEFGQIEANAVGNHATFAYVHKLALFYALREDASALELIKELRTGLPGALTEQIVPSGEMPIETARVTGLTYSLMNMEGLFLLGTVIENLCRVLPCDPVWDWNWEAPVPDETRWEKFEGVISHCKYFGSGSIGSVEACKASCLDKDGCNGVVTNEASGKISGCYFKKCAGSTYFHKAAADRFKSYHLVTPPRVGSGSIRKALEYLLPYARGEKLWTDDHQGTGKETWTALAPSLYRAATIYAIPSYAAEAIQIDNAFSGRRQNLLYPRVGSADTTPAPPLSVGYDENPCSEASLSFSKTGCKWLYGAADCTRFITKAGGTYCAEGAGAIYGSLTIDDVNAFDARCVCCHGLADIDKDSSNHCESLTE
eukprot:TRINITY_DN5935_c0_g1_i1.p1 TRINITY_DN5935_c0_g1~~TRINITY_DN5935_c0_g1_i1.p1  ORF type:complete len:679 (-),score=114.36 TRINITY_DN5935_c0_g1_i1:102-2138(-)